MCLTDPRPGLRTKFLESPIPEVPEQDSWRLVGIVWKLTFYLGIHAAGDDEDIRIAVVVEIANSCTPAHEPSFDSNLRGSCTVIEVSLAIVPVYAAGVAHKMSLEDVKMA